MAARELKPGRKGVAADDGGSQRVGLHGKCGAPQSGEGGARSAEWRRGRVPENAPCGVRSAPKCRVRSAERGIPKLGRSGMSVGEGAGVRYSFIFPLPTFLARARKVGSGKREVR